ncbi:unnamed protein product [Brugia timori]|uniref:PITH domain-containing protein n=1 Tax=Brugia timori TaxID=42155 RepID=A0A158PT02_9BILA|nr:unnamed protein product [Brugia timori]
MSYSDTTINPSEGWSSPFSISQCESDSLKSAGNSEDENEKNEIVIKSASTMDIMNAFNLPIAHHPETTKEMLASFRKQPNHDAKIIISSLPDANIQMSSQSSISLTEKLTKTRVPTDQIVSSTIPEREIVEEDHDLSKWSNAEEKDCDLKVMKSSIQIKHHEIAYGSVDLTLQASSSITFILTGITTSREIYIRKLFVNGQRYAFI